MVEMLVVIAIFGIVTTILLFNLPTFRNQASLDLVAQEVAITIRGAQVFGGGGRVGETGGEAPTYGIYIDKTSPQFDLFRESGVNSGYDNAGDVICAGECIERYALSGGFEISGLKCGETTDCPGTTAQIMFTRPNLEPTFIVDGEESDVGKIGIIIRSIRDNQTREVSVWSNGQIAVGVAEAS